MKQIEIRLMFDVRKELEHDQQRVGFLIERVSDSESLQLATGSKGANNFLLGLAGP